MKQINNYICLVDYYRRPSLFRNTRGCYRVGAKTPEEAKRLLRDKIKFGSILVYYECDAERDKRNGTFVPYKTVVKEEPYFEDSVNENGDIVHIMKGYKQIEPHSATDPVNKTNTKEKIKV